MTTSYPVRTWHIADLPLASVETLPLRPSTEIPFTHVVGLTSSQAESFEKRGVTNVFYYDYEQEAAGLDTIYGSSALQEVTQAFTLPDGTEIAEGALAFPITRMDFEKMTTTILFEKL